MASLKSNVWDYAGVNTLRPGRTEDLAAHPTVKPVALGADAIKDCSRRGEICLTPLADPGTRSCVLSRDEALGEDLDSGPDAFLDTAAVMASLDLIITSDTSIAHLAGALGRPVWIVLKYASISVDSSTATKKTTFARRGAETGGRSFRRSPACETRAGALAQAQRRPRIALEGVTRLWTLSRFRPIASPCGLREHRLDTPVRPEPFSSAEEFLASTYVDQTRCLILDIAMPGMSGPELQRELKLRRNEMPIVFITAHAEESARSSLRRQGAVECLSKPFSNEALLKALNDAFGLS